VSAPANSREMRDLRKRLLVARSTLMRERLAQDLQRSLGPARATMHAAAIAGAVLPLKPIAWAVLSWFLGRRRKRKRVDEPPDKKEKT
jgi:hypothetical protein